MSHTLILHSNKSLFIWDSSESDAMMENPRSRKLCIRNFLQQIHFLKLTLPHHCSSRFSRVHIEIVQIFFWMFANLFFFLQQKLLCKLLVSKYLSTEKRRESIHTESCSCNVGTHEVHKR